MKTFLIALASLVLIAAAPPAPGPNLAQTQRWIIEHLTNQRAADADELISTKSARAACSGLGVREVTTTTADETWEDFSIPLEAQLGAWTASPKGGGQLAVECALCVRVRSSESLVGEGALARSRVSLPLASAEDATRLKTAVDHLRTLCRKPGRKAPGEDIF